MTDALRAHKSEDVWIEESSKPYYLSISEMVESGSARRYTIKHQRVEDAIARIMLALDMDDPDTVMAATAIVFVTLVRQFKLRIFSLIQFAENFLNGGDKKPTCWALRQWLHDDFERFVTRYDTVKLSKAVNATRTLMGDKAYEAAHNGELSKKYY